MILRKLIQKIFNKMGYDIKRNNSLSSGDNLLGLLDDNIITQKLLFKLVCECLAGIQFYGQELQDMYAFLWFKGKRDGFFVDIGAYDGFTISNTYALEKIGWKGICIEPVPSVFELLVKNRRCECVNAALSDNDNMNETFIQTKGGRSGFIRNMSPSMLLAAKDEGIVSEIKVESITFDTLMNEHNTEYIDFMSIDVEGSEIEILKTINFEKYKFGLIAIEHNQPELRSFMKSKGYKVLFNVGVDLLFIPINIDVGKYWWKEPSL